MLYEMISGHAPFVGETPSHIVVSIFEHDPAPLSITSEVPDELLSIVFKALTKNREHRYQKVGDLLVDLKHLKQRLEVNAAIEGATEPREIVDEAGVTRIQQRAVPTDDTAVARTTSRLAHFVNSFKVNRPAWAIVSAIIVVAIVAYLGYSRYRLGSRGSSVRSIAVMPFENQTKDPNSDYLSDGISETLINHLSKLPGVKVSARSSSFKYKGTTVDLPEVAKALGVDAILTGRISQRGDNMVISVELMDARNKTQIWGEQYNRKMADVLVVQSVLCRKLADCIIAICGQHKSDWVNVESRSCWPKGN